MRGAGLFVGFSVSARTPSCLVQEKIHTQISVSYNADWPIRSGYLLANAHILINPFFLIYFSHVALYLFQWGSSHPAASVAWAGVGRINFLLPRILLLSLHHFHFLSGFPTYTSCLANQRLFKTWLTEYRQFSRTMGPIFFLEISKITVWKSIVHSGKLKHYSYRHIFNSRYNIDKIVWRKVKFFLNSFFFLSHTRWLLTWNRNSKFFF